MPSPTVETGLLSGTFPYVPVGDGPGRLVVFAGLNDSLQAVTAAPRFWARFCRGFVDGRTIWFLSRRRGLPTGYSTQQMAADCARVVQSAIGPADVLGLSMGSFIAQHFAVDHPQLVERLVLALAGAKPDPDKANLYRSWHSLACNGRWRDACLDMMNKTYTEWQTSDNQSWIQASPNSLLRQPLDPADFIVSIEACLTHDATERVGRIRSATLVVGATRDELMPASVCRKLAKAIPGAKLQLLEGAGHGVFEQRRDECGRMLAEFLKR